LQVKQAAWRDVCTVPCRVPVPAAGLYRVGGGGSRASDSFLLPRRSDPPVVIDAHLGSVAKFWVGVGLLAGGLGAVASGALTYANAPSDTYSSTSRDQRTVDHAVGTISMVGGGVVALVGLVLLGANGSSVEVR